MNFIKVWPRYTSFYQTPLSHLHIKKLGRVCLWVSGYMALSVLKQRHESKLDVVDDVLTRKCWLIALKDWKLEPQ